MLDFLNGIDYGTTAFFGFQLNQRPQLRPFLETGAHILACPWFLVPLATLVLGLLAVQGRRRTLLLAGIAFLSAILLVEGLQRSLPRARPADSQNYPELLRTSASYPSRGVVLLVLVGSLGAYAAEGLFPGKRWKIVIHLVAVLAMIWLCLGEIALGLHFVTDVVAGILGGAGLALLVRALDRNPGVQPVAT